MKKLLIYALLVTSFSCTAFAVSDIQILLGAQLDFTSVKEKDEYDYWGGGSTDEYTTGFFPGCMIGILNYNLWDIGKGGVSVGFMDSLTFGAGIQFTFDFCIGPALGVSIKDMKLQLSPGFTVGTCAFGGDSFLPLGFYIDLQLKFMQAKRASPVVGLRYEYNSLWGNNNDNDGGEDNRLGIYLALSINIGNKKGKKSSSLYGSGAVREGSIIRMRPSKK